MTKQETINKAQSLFDEGYACSQSVLMAYAEQYNIDEKTAKLISSTFGGGMGRLREKCGALTGGFMVLGLAYGNKNPKDMERKLNSYKYVQTLNNQFIAINQTTICAELLNKYATEDEVEQRKHHQLICRKLVGDAAGLVYDLIEIEKEVNNN